MKQEKHSPPQQVRLGVSIRMSDYVREEFEQFIRGTIDFTPDLASRYGLFLHRGVFKPSTLIDLDVLKVFASDVDNRAQIDFREGNYEDDEKIMRGGKYFDGLSKKMKAHIEALEAAVNNKNILANKK